MIAAVGVDLGTTRVKASLVTPDRRELRFASAPTPWELVGGNLQIDLPTLGDVALRMADAVARFGRDTGCQIAGIACTGMSETGALLAPDGDVLAPGFAWHHTLGDTGPIAAGLGADEFELRTGRKLTTTPSLVKLDYLRRHGQRFEPGQRWLNVPDYVAYRLSGVAAAEISTSSRSGLVDVGALAWWRDAFDFLGAPDLAPGELLLAGTPLGPAGGEVPESLRGVLVTTGGHDHPLAAFSLGGERLGDMDVSLGTAEAQLRIVGLGLTPEQLRALVAAGANVDIHPFGDRHTILLALPSGITMERLSALMGAESRESRRALSQAALEAEPAAVQLVDATLEHFGLTGISDKATQAGVWRAVAEQLVDASAAGTRRLDEILGPPLRLFTFGGWIFDPLVAALRRPLGQVAAPGQPAEPGAMGAALMALRGAGIGV
ncbi:MAG: hypothetical protein LBR32_02240 [Propionibacteriaceae bacterium]|jgi:sugar (pentulose or hexulose) kinase|nr:hypothetical protein [Propionibacteriaceae bacterium]